MRKGTGSLRARSPHPWPLSPRRGERGTRKGALPDEAHGDLRLAGVADAALHGAVEVEDEVRHLGVFRVSAVEEVEDIDGRLGGHAVAEAERFGEAQVE